MTEKKSYNSKKIIIYFSVALFFGVLSFVFFLESDENVTEQEQTIVLIDHTDKEIEIPKKNIDNDSSSSLETKSDTLNQEVLLINQLKGKYLIVIGTFRDKENAVNLSNQMHVKGHDSCHVIYNGSSLYWVSFKSYEKLINAKKDIINFNLDGWIKKI